MTTSNVCLGGWVEGGGGELFGQGGGFQVASLGKVDD